MKIADLGYTIIVLRKCLLLTINNINIIKRSIAAKNFQMIFIVLQSLLN